MRTIASLLPLLTLGAPGCVELTSDDQVSSTEQAVIECDTWVCGSNSPVIDSLHFHELNINGRTNEQGFSVISLRQGSIDYQLVVEEGRILGRLGSNQISGSALQNAEIRLRYGAKTFAIRITQIGTVQTFARLGGAPRVLETYQLDTAQISVGAPTSGWRNLCSNPPRRDNQDVQGMNVAHALVFEGERIDARTKSIGTVIDPTWFNIGCTGHAIAKMAVNGMTEVADKALGFNTTILDRQAFLKMVTADYCGKGRTFTVSGQPLQWMDWHGYTQYAVSPANLEIEARWTADGASCINNPRVIANPSALAQQALGNMVGWDILAECGYIPPSCSGSVTDLDGKLFVSANPL